MNEDQWSQVTNIVYNWIHRHPKASMDQCLALWLGVNDNYKVFQLLFISNVKR